MTRTEASTTARAETDNVGFRDGRRRWHYRRVAHGGFSIAQDLCRRVFHAMVRSMSAIVKRFLQRRKTEIITASAVGMDNSSNRTIDSIRCSEIVDNFLSWAVMALRTHYTISWIDITSETGWKYETKWKFCHAVQWRSSLRKRCRNF